MDITRNYGEEYEAVAIDLAQKIKEAFGENVVGVSLCGSVTAGNADEFSDIDLDVWLPDAVHEEWLVNCPLMQLFAKYDINRETPSNFSFGVGEDYKFDLTILSIDKVRAEEWKVEQKANRYGSRILYDTNDTIKSLLESKFNIAINAFTNKEKYDVTVPNSEDYYKFYISAYLNYHVPVTVARKRYEQAHMNLSWAMNLLNELLWTKHGKFYPYVKSRWFVIDKYLDNEERELFRESQLIREYTEDDVKRRRKVLRELYQKLGYDEVVFYHEKLDLS